MKKGRLIILEGLDGSGKDTQADILVGEYGMFKTRLPYYDNFTGKPIREAIDNGKKDISEEVFQTLMTANYAEHLQKVILPKINEGVDVVMTRFTPSMIAYSEAFGGEEQFIGGLYHSIKSYYNRAIGQRNVIQILIGISVEESLRRIQNRHNNSPQKTEDIFENTKVLTIVSEVYLQQVIWDMVISGEQPIEKVAEDISTFLKLN